MLLAALRGPLTLQPLGPGTTAPSAPGAGGAGGHAQDRRLLL